MSNRVSDWPALFLPGVHPISVERLSVIGVGAFPLSRTRQRIMSGFRDIACDLVGLSIIGDLIIDGSFLTEEINPIDIDFTLCVTPEFYQACSSSQLEKLEWIRDDFSIKATHLCDCNLCVDFPQDHVQYFNGIQSRDFWVKFFTGSKIYNRKRGVAIIRLDGSVL